MEYEAVTDHTTSAKADERLAAEAAAILEARLAVPFDEVPAARRCRVFGVPFNRVNDAGGGQLFVTRYGWSLLEHLLPYRWYYDDAYRRIGQQLPGGTGAVWRVPTWSKLGRRKDVVIKFARFAQEVPLHVARDMQALVDTSLADNARFNSPFEEFAMVMHLRRGPQPMRTKRPLAIYMPAPKYPLWRLGRTSSRFASYRRAMEEDQAQIAPDQRVTLDVNRDYVIIYEWVDGEDAVAFRRQGLLTAQQMTDLTHHAAIELEARGLQVLDHKPEHVILRRRRGTGPLLERYGHLVYVLVDFELLNWRPGAQCPLDVVW